MSAVGTILVAAHFSLVVFRVVAPGPTWRQVDAQLGQLPSLLRLYGRWNMFAMAGKQPGSSSSHVEVRAQTIDGRWRTVISARPEDKSWNQRFRDRSLRKLVRHMSKKKPRRRMERSLLAYFCQATEDLGIEAKRVALVQVRVSAPTVDRPGRTRKKVLAKSRCRRARRTPIWMSPSGRGNS